MNTKLPNQSFLERAVMTLLVTLFMAATTAWAQSSTVVNVTLNGVTPYDDLEDAFSSAEDGAVLQLSANCNLGSTGNITVGYGTNTIGLTLDLNGYTVSGTTDGLVTVNANASLTIIDSRTGGTIASTGEMVINSEGEYVVCYTTTKEEIVEY